MSFKCRQGLIDLQLEIKSQKINNSEFLLSYRKFKDPSPINPSRRISRPQREIFLYSETWSRRWGWGGGEATKRIGHVPFLQGMKSLRKPLNNLITTAAESFPLIDSVLHLSLFSPKSIFLLLSLPLLFLGAFHCFQQVERETSMMLSLLFPLPSHKEIKNSPHLLQTKQKFYG